MLFGSANRHESRFRAPDEVHVDRSGPPHVAFGSGRHFCLGAHLARLEATAALGALLAGTAWIERDPAGPPERRATLVVRGWRSQPVRIDPRKRRREAVDFELTDGQRDFLARFRAYLDTLDVEGIAEEADADLQEVGPKGQSLLRRMGADGWLGVGWPVAYGGKGATAVEQWLAREELEHRGLPHGGMALTCIGPTLMRVGTEKQKREFLPRIIAGEIEFALGYTEPNAGSDLAALVTRAVRDGDEYVVNGQKVYTTAAHYASHIWLAARTGEARSRHNGISVLIVPIDAPGITVRPLHTQSDGRTNEVFFSDVRVPVDQRVGDENEGWSIITMALDFERLLPYARNRHYLERLVAWAGQGDGAAPLDDSDVAHRLARLAADTEVARLLALRTAWLIDTGAVPNVEASMLKVWLSQLRQDIAVEALAVIGPTAQVRIGEPGAPAGGIFERLWRASTVLKFAGGTNEVQRNIIAQRGLGLPR